MSLIMTSAQSVRTKGRNGNIKDRVVFKEQGGSNQTGLEENPESRTFLAKGAGKCQLGREGITEARLLGIEERGGEEEETTSLESGLPEVWL